MTSAAGIVAGRRRRVVIVGGGLAGLSAAETLARSGANLVVTLLEARSATGGRAGSFFDPLTGQSVDYCQHVAMGCCTNLLQLMTDCGLGDAFDRHDRLTFHYPGSPPSTFAPASWLPAPLHMLPALYRLAYLSPDQRRQIRRATWALMRSSPHDLASITAMAWLRQHGQSEATTRDYWNTVVASALGESCEAVSMRAARKVFVDGFLAARRASDVLIPRQSLRELFGTRLPEAIGRLGVSIMTRSPVRQVRLDRSDPLGERLALDLRDTHLLVDHAILAVPWHQLAKLIEPSLAARAALAVDLWAAVPASPISGVHLWFDRMITDAPHAVLVGTLAQWLFRRPAEGESSGTGHYYQVVISASHALRQMSHQQVVSQVVAELTAAFPATASATVVNSRVVTDPQSVFSIRPEVDAVRPQALTALPYLHLAGDFVQTGWPATMEGAVISGRKAANSVLRRLGHAGVDIHDGLPPSWLSRLLIRR